MKILPILCIATASLFVCHSVEAQEKRGGGSGRILAKLDTDKDRKISKEEAKGTRLEKRFAKLDKNEDGFLTKDELGGRRGKGKGKRRRKGAQAG